MARPTRPRRTPLGHTLTVLRRAHGWTQAQAAARLGVSRPYLTMIEGGRRALGVHALERFARAYNVNFTIDEKGVWIG